MRVVLAGAARDRERLRATLLAEEIEVVAEFASVAEAHRAALDVDAIVLAPLAAGDRDPDPLTPRELEVLNLLVEGLSNKAIAARLGISDQTVKFHVAAICGKLGAANRTEAVRRAIRRGIVAI
jgi:two-component system, NarL family, nitrate/nitrite response regulator NarL